MIDVYVELENICWKDSNAESSQENKCSFTISVHEGGIFRKEIEKYLQEKSGHQPISWDYKRLIVVRDRY